MSYSEPVMCIMSSCKRHKLCACYGQMWTTWCIFLHCNCNLNIFFFHPLDAFNIWNPDWCSSTRYGLERCRCSYNKSTSVWVGVIFNIFNILFNCDWLLDFPCNIRVIATCALPSLFGEFRNIIPSFSPLNWIQLKKSNSS